MSMRCARRTRQAYDGEKFSVIENLKRNALRFVVISWAAEKHQGEYYVNRQDEKTLINRMCSDGSFIYNEIASSYLRKSCQLSFYQETLLIFQKV